MFYLSVRSLFLSFKLESGGKNRARWSGQDRHLKKQSSKILQDNLEENGTRVGEQKVRVRMLTGVRKGEELDITSSSGYLFGAACKPGMKVIVMQSVAGDSTVASVYTQDREGVIYILP